MKPGSLVRLSLRIDFGPEFRLGPGKVELLEAIDETGSISAAGRRLGMSYRRAWLLVDSLNVGFRGGVVETAPGGKHGGGAKLTETARQVIASYRNLERMAADAASAEVKRLASLLAAPPRR